MSLYCDTPVPAFQPDICANEPSRIIAIGFLRLDTQITDFTNATQWNTDIANGRAVVIKNVRGEKPKSSPNSIDGFGKEQTRNVGRDFTVNFVHPDACDNVDFWNAMNFNNSHTFVYYTQGGKLFVEQEAIASVDADIIIPVGLNDILVADVAVSWASQNAPLCLSGPASVFEC